MVHTVTLGLLLVRHVGGRADHFPLHRDAGIVDRAGQAEVGDLRHIRKPRQEDVARLDVAVDQPQCVRGGQARRHLKPDLRDLRRRQGALLLDPLLE